MTTAKLRDCVRDANLPCQHPVSTGGNCWDCLTCSAREAVREISLPLARLVLTLTEALETVDECCGCVATGPSDLPRKALVAVEELEL